MVRPVLDLVKRNGLPIEALSSIIARLRRLRLEPRGSWVLQMDDTAWMERALELAREAAKLGEVPVGAVVVSEGELVGSGYNRRETDGDPLAHAEILALRQAAAKVADWRLLDFTLYVTLEPCAMCAGALVNSRVKRLVYGAKDPKAGFCGSLGNLVSDPRLNHRLEVTAGVLERESSSLLRAFFSELRKRHRTRRSGGG